MGGSGDEKMPPTRPRGRAAGGLRLRDQHVEVVEGVRADGDAVAAEYEQPAEIDARHGAEDELGPRPTGKRRHLSGREVIQAEDNRRNDHRHTGGRLFLQPQQRYTISIDFVVVESIPEMAAIESEAEKLVIDHDC